MDELRRIAYNAKVASFKLAAMSSEQKNLALSAIADALHAHRNTIIMANARDIECAREAGMSEWMIDRLSLSEGRLRDMADGVRQLIALRDPIGTVFESLSRPNGLNIKRVCVPLGVILMIYEARPNVTVDAAAIALKTGNAIVLRGSSNAIHSNMALVDVMRAALRTTGTEENAVTLVMDTSHESTEILVKLTDTIDVVIPRGGANLIRRVMDMANVPVIETGVGNCHIFIDESAEYEMAQRIVINAKTQRPSVCNAVETLLIHERWGDENITNLLSALMRHSVTIHGDERICGCHKHIIPAGEEDWNTEYLSLDLAVKLVSSVDEAIAHIRHYGTRHTEAIVSESGRNVERFLNEVDAACVNRNASTRFTDGFEFGFGAEIGISTQKLHARGPLSLREMTSYKYVVLGNGQIRE